MMHLSLNCFSPFIGSSRDGSESDKAIQGTGTTTVTAVMVFVSCVVSFIIGALVVVVAYYCAARKKHSVAFSQLREQPNARSTCKDVSAGNMELKENEAFVDVLH